MPDPIQDLGQANDALRALAEIEAAREARRRWCQRKIEELKAEFEAEDAPWAEDERELAGELTRFIKSKHFAALLKECGSRTIKLNAGVIGFRTPPATLKFARGFTEEDAIAAIKKRWRKEDWDIWIQTRESLRKDDLKSMLSEEELARLGLSLSAKEKVVIEPASDVKPQPAPAAAQEGVA